MRGLRRPQIKPCIKPCIRSYIKPYVRPYIWPYKKGALHGLARPKQTGNCHMEDVVALDSVSTTSESLAALLRRASASQNEAGLRSIWGRGIKPSIFVGNLKKALYTRPYKAISRLYKASYSTCQGLMKAL